MHQGNVDLEPAVQAPRRMRLENRGGRYPVKIYYTGAPPLATQLKDQVRSGSGMTYGVPTHDGARMPQAFTSWQFPRATASQAETSVPKLKCDMILADFQAIEAAGGVLPTRSRLYAIYGRNLLTQLRFMERTGRIDLWIAEPDSRDRGIAIRIAGSDVVLRTPDCAPNVRF